jgi:hypothetical protein
VKPIKSKKGLAILRAELPVIANTISMTMMLKLDSIPQRFFNSCIP